MTNEKVSTGIDGLNTMLGGGFPQGQIIALLGSCGTGKTTLSLQFIWTGLQSGEKCIFISLEEGEADIISNAMNYGWDLKPHVENGTLTLVKLEPSDAKSTLAKIKSELPAYIKNTGAKRVVFDSISLLSMLFDSDSERRSGLFELCKQIKNSGATALFTAEVDPDNPDVSRDGLVEYVADGVILLRYNEANNDIHLSVRIVKLRRSNHQRRIKPYNITARGIEVLEKAEVF
ncbi:MAG: KaiC domain-containing protein [Candidatus Thermoplasmatota archaeon]|nr:KaiC domain-containing protein [Euryarchaeota archaeon]MBU4032912.1 KaiC domain-containing protein [Candidatus Thermoplasmatota archaeon]MBU4072202.1 KaiC domain-containing protein [Candidatus Thermoplasmatota archaeon]MBU4144894.1 KaiC domain-containing protein [Candidatus Thermoplasmatota archaeon]MBU4590999.1 KaiC domain-containing protein [Candidatus Thermoplasmatota archaeon]